MSFSDRPFESAKIKKESAVDKLCDSIRERILSGVWRTNDKLPTEHELSEMFGLNRITVRAALQRLNALGILETRVGDGTYVCAFDFTELIANVSDFYTSSDLLEDVWEFRQIVEGGSARLIVENATPEEVEELRRISDEMSACQDLRTKNNGEATTEQINHSYQLVFRFHEQLFRMTHNRLLYYAHAVSREAVCRALMISGERRIKHFYETGELEKLKFQEKIVDAIAAKDCEACQAALCKYVGPDPSF